MPRGSWGDAAAALRGARARRRRTTTVLTLVGTLLLGAAAGVAYAHAQTRDLTQALVRDVAAAARAQEAAGHDLDRAARDAAALLTALEEKAEGDPAATALRRSIDDARAQAAARVDLVPPDAHLGTLFFDVGAAQTYLDGSDDVLAGTSAAEAALEVAIEAAQTRYDEVVLKEARATAAQARAALDASLAAGEELLAGTEGAVADDEVRAGLRRAVDVAGALPGAPADGSLQATEASARSFAEARVAVDAALERVREEHEAWRAEQERLAAEEAARAAAELMSYQRAAGVPF
ncbi:hypothetical protein DNL40_13735 [Xylanimonas oleitrophica]|uniref:Uncharacterized protein n=1 Tax=Xylanimonas oleitrophica TaxID=2607479 RepID=A0A2W5WW61_9MICO|nr:hypothetical protein [Xylanimonas oleitrophica]PZR52065.1 hypothetical protein DNL40_13735 [Xylanimonas oleitrophica]